VLSKNINSVTIEQLIDSGLKTSEIASNLGISSATVSYWKKKLGKELNNNKHDWKKIQEAHNNGSSYSQLYKEFGVTKRALQKARDRGDFKVRQRKRLSKEEAKIRKRIICREAWMRYYSRKKYQTPADEDIKKLQEFYANCPIGYEVDHIIPISKGGLHTLSNLQYLTIKENRQKSNKIL